MTKSNSTFISYIIMSKVKTHTLLTTMKRKLGGKFMLLTLGDNP